MLHRFWKRHTGAFRDPCEPSIRFSWSCVGFYQQQGHTQERCCDARGCSDVSTSADHDVGTEPHQMSRGKDHRPGRSPREGPIQFHPRRWHRPGHAIPCFRHRTRLFPRRIGTDEGHFHVFPPRHQRVGHRHGGIHVSSRSSSSHQHPWRTHQARLWTMRRRHSRPSLGRFLPARFGGERRTRFWRVSVLCAARPLRSVGSGRGRTPPPPDPFVAEEGGGRKRSEKAQLGFMATKKNMGVNRFILPPATSPSAPSSRK